LDDDLVLEPEFFKELLNSFTDPNVIGADGLITNECYWVAGTYSSPCALYLDGYTMKLSQRDRIRALFGLYPFELK
jgi:hypothetical protein